MSLDRVEVFYINNKPSYAYLSESFAQNNNIKGLFGPSTLKWEKIVDYTTPMEHSSSKRRRRVQKAYELLQSQNRIVIQEKLKKDYFLKWHSLNTSNLSTKEHVIKLSPNWFDSSPSASRSAGIFVLDEEKNVIGGVIIIKNSDSASFQTSYRAHLYTKVLGSSLSEVIEYLIDLFAITNNYKKITRGTDQNLYGIVLSIGLAQFKTVNHFQPKPLDTHGIYYPRYLIFFQTFENILTYVYSDVRNEIIAKELCKTEMEQYVYDFEVLQNIND